MKWVHASDLETKIIISLGSHKKSQAQIARDIKRNPKCVRTTVNRLENQGIISRSKDYVKDSRVSLIEIDKKKIKVKRIHDFYQRFFILQILTIFISIIFSIILRNIVNFMFIWVFTICSVLPGILYMAYKAYITKDRITVDKNILERGRYNKNKNEDKVASTGKF